MLLCAPPLFLGVRTTGQLDWPEDADLYRDIAQAQSFAQGRFDDPFYKDEGLWYNPLVPLVVAGTARASGWPVQVLYTRLGAYLNLLAPLAFGLLVARLFGASAGLAGTFGFLYLGDPREPPWASPTYSPWLFSASFAQALFYASLWLYWQARQTRRGLAYALAGAAIGGTFLGHSAPGLIAALLCGGLETWELLRASAAERAARGRRLLLLAGVAALVAAPFLAVIVGRYHLRVVNRAPMEWTWGLARSSAGLMAQASWKTLVAAGVLLMWARRRGLGEGERLLLGWLVAAALLLAYSFAAPQLGLPALMPRHHFLLYLKAGECALFGCAVGTLLASAPPRLREGRAAGLLLVAAVLAVLPAYRLRPAFAPGHPAGEKWTTRPTREGAFRWIRRNAAPGDVFLASDEIGLTVVGPAGAKVVAVEAPFSNPYAAWQPRAEARERMVQALKRGDHVAFSVEAEAFGVTYVVRSRLDREWPQEGELARLLTTVYDNRHVQIYRVEPDAEVWYHPESPLFSSGVGLPRRRSTRSCCRRAAGRC